jgi:hypothetical protein
MSDRHRPAPRVSSGSNPVRRSSERAPRAGVARLLGRKELKRAYKDPARWFLSVEPGEQSFVCGAREPGSSLFAGGETSSGLPQYLSTEPGSRFSCRPRGHRFRRNAWLPSFARITPSHCPTNPSIYGQLRGRVDLLAPRRRARDGAVIHVTTLGTLLHGRPVNVYSLLTHPRMAGPGIDYGRGSAFDTGAAGRRDFQTKGVSVSMPETGEERNPQPPPGTTPEPGQMPEEPGTAPEAPTMPEDPDRDPSQSPPDESGNP